MCVISINIPDSHTEALSWQNEEHKNPFNLEQKIKRNPLFKRNLAPQSSALARFNWPHSLRYNGGQSQKSGEKNPLKWLFIPSRYWDHFGTASGCCFLPKPFHQPAYLSYQCCLRRLHTDGKRWDGWSSICSDRSKLYWWGTNHKLPEETHPAQQTHPPLPPVWLESSLLRLGLGWGLG